MPVHDWTRVDAGIFHDFHHAWIEEIKRALNSGILPDDFYALAEQFAGGFGPDVLTLEGPPALAHDDADQVVSGTGANGTHGGVVLAAPPIRLTAETDMEFYRRTQNVVVVRHVSGDRVVAVVEIVSPGNKAGRRPFRSFVEMAAELLDQQVHLLIADVLPRGVRDPQGVHAAIWEEISGESYETPLDKPLTFASYEAAIRVRAYVEQIALDEDLPAMPLFLAPGACVSVPLSATYATAFAAVPRRWKTILERPSSDS
jgi:hypothetical protein